MSSYSRPTALRWDDRWAAWSVFLLLLAVYSATFTGLPDVPDAEVEFQTTSALVRSGSAALGGTPEAQALVAARFGVVPGRGERAGRWYSRYGIGQALVALPLYLAGDVAARLLPEIERRHASSEAYGVPRSEYFAHLAVGLRNPLLTAATALLLVLTVRRLGVGRAVAWWTGMGYGLCTFAWPQARSTLSDVQATFFLFFAFHGVVRARETFERLKSPRAGRLTWIGVCLAAAVLTRIAVLPAALVLLLVAWRVLHAGHGILGRAWSGHAPPGGRALALHGTLVLAPFALALAALAAWNRVRLGSLTATGYEHGLDFAGFFSQPPLLGLWGLLASPGRGLLWMAPALLLLPLALRRERATQDAFWSRTLFVLVPAVIVPVAFLRGWHGAWTFGPRYLLPLLPFLWIGVGLALESPTGRGRLARRLAAALLALGLVVQASACLVDAATHLDLGLQAARVVWPTPEGLDEVEMDARRFEELQWDWRFAAPWAHWRIFRHRMAGLGEDFGARAIYFVEGDLELRPAHARARGFAHLAWVDLHQRLGGPLWPAALSCTLLLVLGSIAGFRATHWGAAGG